MPCAPYGPSMEEVRERPPALDQARRPPPRGLDKLLPEYGLDKLTEAELDDLNKAWHRLDPWPDSVAGLTRLKTKFTLFTLSNGNVALMVDMAKRAGLPWDAILGAEVTRHYKPQPECYLWSAELLGLRPDECMLVAAPRRRSPSSRCPLVCTRRSLAGLTSSVAPVRRTRRRPGSSTLWRAFLDLAGQLGC